MMNDRRVVADRVKRGAAGKSYKYHQQQKEREQYVYVSIPRGNYEMVLRRNRFGRDTTARYYQSINTRGLDKGRVWQHTLYKEIHRTCCHIGAGSLSVITTIVAVGSVIFAWRFTGG